MPGQAVARQPRETKNPQNRVAVPSILYLFFMKIPFAIIYFNSRDTALIPNWESKVESSYSSGLSVHSPCLARQIIPQYIHAHESNSISRIAQHHIDGITTRASTYSLSVMVFYILTNLIGNICFLCDGARPKRDTSRQARARWITDALYEISFLVGKYCISLSIIAVVCWWGCSQAAIPILPEMCRCTALHCSSFVLCSTVELSHVSLDPSLPNASRELTSLPAAMSATTPFVYASQEVGRTCGSR